MKTVASLIAISSLSNAAMVAPVTAACKLGVNYDFEGVECRAWGDPHWTMFSGGNHQFMGRLGDETKGTYKDSFYYVARCDRDQTKQQMPFQIIGTHYYSNAAHWKKNVVDLLDYITVELEGTDGKKYYIYYYGTTSGQKLSYAPEACGGSINYDDTRRNTKNKNCWECLDSKNPTNYISVGNSGFRVKLSTQWLYLMPPTGGETLIYMKGHTYPQWVPTKRNQLRTRYWQDFRVRMASQYKCMTCGVCGQFTKPSRGNYKQMVKECDKHWVEVRNIYQDEAYDPDGWTYEYNFFNDKCGTEIHTDLAKDVDKGDFYKCPKWKQVDVDKACDKEMARRDVNAACPAIDRAEGPGQCDQMKAQCGVDACFGSSIDSGAKQTAQEIIEAGRDAQNDVGYARSDNINVDEQHDDDMFDEDVDDDIFDDGQFEEEPQNEEYGAYDDDVGDNLYEPDDDQFVYQPKPRHVHHHRHHHQRPMRYVPPAAPSPSMITLNNIFMMSLIIMVIAMTVSVTLCCMRRSQKVKAYSPVNVYSDEQTEFVN